MTQDSATPPQSIRGPKDQEAGGPKRFGLRVALLLLSLCLASAAFELGLRLFCRSLDSDRRGLLYRYDAQLGWFPAPNSRGTFTASRTIAISHNSMGFRGTEHLVPTNKPVIAFLGDSFVWGFDVEAEERFTEKLQARHPEWGVFNLGVCGYGTDQEYLLLQRYFDRYHPRVVFVVFCVDNDDSDNCWNYRWGYYKPYCVVEGTRLELKGTPVPRGARVFEAAHPSLCRLYLARLAVRAFSRLKGPPPEHHANPTGPILSDLQKYARSKGALLVVGTTHRWPPLEAFLQQMQIPWVDLSTDLVFPANGRHWTPEGHAWVAGQIDAFLSQKRYLDLPTVHGAE